MPFPIVKRSCPAPVRRLCGRDEHGQATVEFALLLPLLMLILVGMLDFGRAVNYYNTLTEIAADGARSAAVNNTPDGVPCASPCGTAIQTQLKSQAVSNELASGIKVRICRGTGVGTGTGTIAAGQPVLVQTQYSFSFIPFLKFTALDLTGSATMRAEANGTYSLNSDDPSFPCP